MKFLIYARGAPHDAEPLSEHDTPELAHIAYMQYDPDTVEIRRSNPHVGAVYPNGIDLHLPGQPE